MAYITQQVANRTMLMKTQCLPKSWSEHYSLYTVSHAYLHLLPCSRIWVMCITTFSCYHSTHMNQF